MTVAGNPLRGDSLDANVSGVTGQNTAGGAGVEGRCSGPQLIPAAATRAGVFGTSTVGPGVLGRSVEGQNGVEGVSLRGAGVHGQSTEGTGVYGESTRGTGVHGRSSDSAAVRGEGGVVGVEGLGTSFGVQGFSPDDTGVSGRSNSGVGVRASTVDGIAAIRAGVSGSGIGVESRSLEGDAVRGIGTFGNGVAGVSRSDFASGVYGETVSPVGGFGVAGRATNRLGGWGGFFDGGALVNGQLQVDNGTKLFRIDHPLDPENKYLSHTCIESSEMKNVYDGVEQLEADGTAWVELPEWFEALNRDFRYQLTAVGGSAPELHVAEEISDNRFKIAGGKEGIKVCWQVTGIRKDRWAEANPLEVEQEKPEEERGRYLQPDLYDAPEERRIMLGPPLVEPSIEREFGQGGEEG